ncbi:BQ2448_5214 [Microbotryum intermedium]|uniref:BQ2448_5214 protein n=1 Tax=Microbotryum intermedium TaxID=269621 RepID=A0A238F6I0_9BASI|nr:BQ2448_5214 [Microbotryum intermedium]
MHNINTLSSRQIIRHETDLFTEFRRREISLCQYLTWYSNQSTTSQEALIHLSKLCNNHWSSFQFQTYT